MFENVEMFRSCHKLVIEKKTWGNNCENNADKP